MKKRKGRLADLQSGLSVLLSRALGRIAAAELPRPVLATTIIAYSLVYGVDLADAVEPTSGFKRLDEFFARRIDPGLRPICADSDALISPVDGTLLGFGNCSREGGKRLEIKGELYDICQLVGRDPGGEEPNPSGGFAVFYLHPRDCHRVQVPADCFLEEVRHIPGARFPVASWFEFCADEIYARNERLVFDFETPGGGRLSLVMVAALGVGNIDSQYSPIALDDKPSTLRFDAPPDLHRGDDLASFRLGSTVVLLWSKAAVDLDENLAPGAVIIGQKLGELRSRHDV